MGLKEFIVEFFANNAGVMVNGLSRRDAASWFSIIGESCEDGGLANIIEELV